MGPRAAGQEAEQASVPEEEEAVFSGEAMISHFS